jgi:hypothetical protein
LVAFGGLQHRLVVSVGLQPLHHSLRFLNYPPVSPTVPGEQWAPHAVSAAMDNRPDDPPISSRFCCFLFGSGGTSANSSAIHGNSLLYHLARVEMQPSIVILALPG